MVALPYQLCSRALPIKEETRKVYSSTKNIHLIIRKKFTRFVSFCSETNHEVRIFRLHRDRLTTTHISNPKMSLAEGIAASGIAASGAAMEASENFSSSPELEITTTKLRDEDDSPRNSNIRKTVGQNFESGRSTPIDIPPFRQSLAVLKNNDYFAK